MHPHIHTKTITDSSTHTAINAALNACLHTCACTCPHTYTCDPGTLWYSKWINHCSRARQEKNTDRRLCGGMSNVQFLWGFQDPALLSWIVMGAGHAELYPSHPLLPEPQPQNTKLLLVYITVSVFNSQTDDRRTDSMHVWLCSSCQIRNKPSVDERLHNDLSGRNGEGRDSGRTRGEDGPWHLTSHDSEIPWAVMKDGSFTPLRDNQ